MGKKAGRNKQIDTENTKFKVGDMVTWESQSKGYKTRKTGKVEQVVKPGECLNLYGLRVLGSGFGMDRKHISYLINVGNVAYWPLVKHLRYS